MRDSLRRRAGREGRECRRGEEQRRTATLEKDRGIRGSFCLKSKQIDDDDHHDGRPPRHHEKRTRKNIYK